MTNQITKQNQDGELREDGELVIFRTEKPNGWIETRKVGRLKIRGEKEPRTISYADYAKLLTFYTGQARLIKDRKHIMVALSGGKFVNTADITSLELENAEVFIEKKPTVPEQLAGLPTEWIRWTDEETGRTFEALCHFSTEESGAKKYHKEPAQIPELRELRYDENNRPTICGIWRYGIPQL